MCALPYRVYSNKNVISVIFQPKEKGNKRPHHLANVGSALKFLTTKNVSDKRDSYVCCLSVSIVFIIRDLMGSKESIFSSHAIGPVIY